MEFFMLMAPSLFKSAYTAVHILDDSIKKKYFIVKKGLI
jgi:hypothetical protein